MQGFVVKALENIDKGDEIFITYGDKCNSSYFVDYGFVLEHNMSNTVPIVIKLFLYYPDIKLKFDLVAEEYHSQPFIVPGDVDEDHF